MEKKTTYLKRGRQDRNYLGGNEVVLRGRGTKKLYIEEGVYEEISRRCV